MSINVGICVPTSGLCRIEFVDSLLSAVQATEDYETYTFELFWHASSVIPANRDKIVSRAIENGRCDKILFIDDDMKFPPDAIKDLLRASTKYPIIAANCVKRQLPIEFMAVKDGKQWDSRKSPAQYTEVDYVGNAFICIDSEVFREVEKPWFMFPYMVETASYHTEDYYFQEKAKKLGYKVIVDNWLSKRISHMGVAEFRP